MKWAEMIKLRFTEGDREAVDRVLADFISGIGGPDGLRKIDLLRRNRIAGDLCLLIHWDLPEAAPRGSATGLSLVHLLGEFGLTNHSVWIEGKTMKTPLHGRTSDRLRQSGQGSRGGPGVIIDKKRR